ncbi:unnamed protein product [Notodromas monacha]|uniref:Uncharacterized protein n=1 Tax=Notodromas monacha TaxID=399045 RepID=A0A7R9BGG3_9CRUS|nr:unnamed protein product [Notodromas monacha]CAG0914837.1 unnamed protein product [Notodromas monacha]
MDDFAVTRLRSKRLKFRSHYDEDKALCYAKFWQEPPPTLISRIIDYLREEVNHEFCKCPLFFGSTPPPSLLNRDAIETHTPNPAVPAHVMISIRTPLRMRAISSRQTRALLAHASTTNIFTNLDEHGMFD